MAKGILILIGIVWIQASAMSQLIGGHAGVGIVNMKTFSPTENYDTRALLSYTIGGGYEQLLNEKNSISTSLGHSRKGYAVNINRFPESENAEAKLIIGDLFLNFSWYRRIKKLSRKNTVQAKLGVFNSYHFSTNWAYAELEKIDRSQDINNYDFGLTYGLVLKHSINKKKILNFELTGQKGIIDLIESRLHQRYSSSIQLSIGLLFESRKKLGRARN